MSYNRFLELLTRKKSGALSLPEQMELNRFLEANPEYEELTDMVEDLFQISFNKTGNIDDQYLQERWNAIQYKTVSDKWPEPQRSRKLSVFYYVAAASIVAFVLGYFIFFQHRENGPLKQNFVSTKKGSKTNLKLPDGTLVWLNADSRIAYDKEFGKNTREVTLTGEAFFDVVHDAQHPFIVHTRAMDVKVLGTAFNVKAYDADEETEATLLRGSIEVSLKKDGTRKILLKPDEKLTVRDEESKEEPQNTSAPGIEIAAIHKLANDSVAIEAQWVKNRLAFNNERLEDVARQISRWYGIEIEIRSDMLKEKKFTGIFEEESPAQVMEALKLTGGFKYAIEKNKITIVP